MSSSDLSEAGCENKANKVLVIVETEILDMSREINMKSRFLKHIISESILEDLRYFKNVLNYKTYGARNLLSALRHLAGYINYAVSKTKFINFNNHKYLYSYKTPEDVKRSLAFAKSLKSTYHKKINMHFYWRDLRTFGRKQALAIKSAIATQNLENTRIILWSESDVDLAKNDFAKPLLPFIETKIWDLKEEIKGSPLELFPEFINEQIRDSKCYLDSDLFRILCLHNYGGIYLDMDMVILRDFAPLLKYEFMYHYGYGNNHNIISGAVMRMYKKSLLAKDMLFELANTTPEANTKCWGTWLFMKVRRYNKNWYVLPFAWFDTELSLKLGMNFFKKQREENGPIQLFEGAFTWDWHNRWDESVEEGSKFHLLESIVEGKFLRKSKLAHCL